LTCQVSGEYKFSAETLECAMMFIVITKPLPRGRIVKFRKCTQNTTWDLLHKGVSWLCRIAWRKL